MEKEAYACMHHYSMCKYIILQNLREHYLLLHGPTNRPTHI